MPFLDQIKLVIWTIHTFHQYYQISPYESKRLKCNTLIKQKEVKSKSDNAIKFNQEKIKI